MNSNVANNNSSNNALGPVAAFGHNQLPEQQQAALRRAIRLE